MHIWPTKRGWKRFAIGLGILVALVLIANGLMAWRTEWRLRAKIAAIRAAGDPASIADLAPQPIPDSENAAALLNTLGPRLDEFSKDNWRFLDKTPLGKGYDKRGERGEPATPEQFEAIRKILNKYPDIDAGLAAAAACDKYASMADFSAGYPKFLEEIIGQQTSRIRAAARFLKWRMETLTAEGQREKAVEHGIELLRLARLYDHEPTIVNMLVAIAMRGIAVDSLYDALAAGPVSPATHAALDHELALHDDPQRMVHALKTERAFSIDAMAALPHAGPEPPGWLFQVIGWPVKRYFVGDLDYFDIEIASADRLSTEPHDKVGGQHVREAPSGHGVLAELMIPALQAAYGADARGTAVLRALRIFNAQRQFAVKNGREAANLNELGLPKEVTIDPFSGEPLKLKHTDDGEMIYSVMLNGVDDGGDFDQLKDFGVAPRRDRVVYHEEESSDDETPGDNGE